MTQIDGVTELLLPIREVTRQTGVHPVTLRAWERRYGLIQPLRSSKGHRLYSLAHIEQIRAVLGWLERGVAVGQVKRLLDEPQALSGPSNDHWREQQQAWLQCLAQLSEARLEDRFNELSALYPAETLYRQLLLPLLAHVNQQANHSSGQRLEQVCLLTWLRSKLALRVQQNNRLQPHAPVLLVNLSDASLQVDSWLCAWLLSQAGCVVQVLDGPVAAAELAAAANRLNAQVLVLHAAQSLDLNYLQRGLERVACPVLLCGEACLIHAEQLQAFNSLAVADSPLQALDQLQRLGWIECVAGEV